MPAGRRGRPRRRDRAPSTATEPTPTAASAGTDATVQRTAVLAIDTSNSMRGARFEAAKEAALDLPRHRPRRRRVGIVSFDGEVTTALEPTPDRDGAPRRHRRARAQQGTLLYDGILAAVDLAGDEGQRSLLVLSDGADTSKTPRSPTSRPAIEATATLVDVVSLDAEQAEGDSPRSSDLADGRAGRGDQRRPATPSPRRSPPRPTCWPTRSWSPRTCPTASTPRRPRSRSRCRRPRRPRRQGVHDDPGAPRRRRPRRRPVGRRRRAGPGPDWVLYAGIARLRPRPGRAALLLVPAQAAADDPRRPGRRRTPAATGAGKQDAKPVASRLAQAKEAAADVLRRNKGLEDRITRRLEGAGSELQAVRVAAAPHRDHRRRRPAGPAPRRRQPRRRLPVPGPRRLRCPGSTWASAGPAAQGVQRRPARHPAADVRLAGGRSVAGPVGRHHRPRGQRADRSEFKRVLVETRLGVSLEDALEGVAERFDSKDFAWVVMAIRIQRQVGGNLAELLDTVAATMREREYLRRQVAALAAEGKLSAFVLAGLPPGFLLYLLLTNRDYVDAALHRAARAGHAGRRDLWLGVGVFWMSRWSRWRSDMILFFVMGLILVAVAHRAASAVGGRPAAAATASPARSRVSRRWPPHPSTLTEELDLPVRRPGPRAAAGARAHARSPAHRRRHRRADPPQARPRRQPAGLDRRPRPVASR